MKMSRLTRDGIAEPVSRDQTLRHERGQGNIHFYCSADHVKDWQPYPVDPYSCYMCDHTVDGARNFERSTWYVFISDVVATAADFNQHQYHQVSPLFFFVTTVRVLFRFCFLLFFVSLEMWLFPSIFVPCSITMESTSYGFSLPDGVFLPCDHGMHF